MVDECLQKQLADECLSCQRFLILQAFIKLAQRVMLISMCANYGASYNYRHVISCELSLHLNQWDSVSYA